MRSPRLQCKTIPHKLVLIGLLVTGGVMGIKNAE
jgi:hypothetical protein